jgi:Holliday junction resolvase
MLFEERGWKTVRSGASLGESDLICIRGGRCVLLQVKSTKKKKFYYYEYMEPRLEGMEFYLVVDFGYGKIRVMPPTKISTPMDGYDIKEFLGKLSEEISRERAIGPR